MTVSALALAGLTRDLVVAALPTEWAGDPTRPWLTRPTVARTPEQVAAAAGSKYSSCPSLKLLDPALRDGAGRLLVVGRPCQVTALRKRARLADGAGIREGVTLVVGLFCMWAVSYRALAALATEGGHAAPRRVDVPQGRFVVETAEGSFELDHERVRALARPACARCEDFTAELADVAVGSTEWRDDWNTLIVRSETGEERVTAAEQAGWLELEPFPAEREARLRQAARGKKARVRRRLAEGGE